MKETAVLLIDCPDQKGLVARVSSLLYRHGANILHADQHQDHDLGLFFMRVEWALNGSANSGSSTAQPVLPGSKAPPRAVPFDLEAFKAEFAPLARELNMRWKLTAADRRPRMALFCSQYLHCMADLLFRWRAGELECEIPLIISNHRAVADLAVFYGIPFEYVSVTAATSAQAEQRQLELLARHQIELVVLARYMQILSPAFVARYPNSIINVHHSFLPAFTGAKPYHAAHARGVKLIGATAHFVTANLDEGPIIEQAVERITHADTPDDLVRKGRDIERRVLARAVRYHLEDRVILNNKKSVVFKV